MLIEQRYTTLGDMAEKENVSQEDGVTLAAQQGWSVIQTGRWLRRYRSQGLYGLAPAH